ncbi:Aminoglycoside phosphotransferase [Penicillium herquei]|nr:Aminoglycoside phosphotransferase [Penicillium herquei]
MFPEEKVRNEVAVMKFILDQTSTKIPIPVPSISCWGQQHESPANMGPFIIMDYIDHYGNMRDLLEFPDRQPGERPILNPDISPFRLEFLYRKLAKIILSLSTLTFDRIGSIKLNHDDGSTWKVSHRPLSYSMNDIVQLGTLPRSKVPNIIHHTASSYFKSLAELHLSHLIHQRNDSIDSEEDCRRKFVARYLFRKIIQDPQLNSQWIFHEEGPFPLWCDDFRPENVLINKDEDIAAVVDWEFTYTAPVGFMHAPPWWLPIEKPE